MKKYISLLIVTLLVFCLAGCSSNYEKGITAFNAGIYETALEHFEKAENQEEVKDWVEVSKKALEFENLYVGSTITLGHFEQDNLTTNGEEEIEWIVLDKESDRMLVISKYILGQYTHHLSGRDVWEKSEIRKYLNDDFLNYSFNEAEKSLINTTDLTTADNKNYGTDGGKNTEDKIFLLSYEEATTYFQTNDSRIAECTPYAYEMEAYMSIVVPYNGRVDYVVWSLRTPGKPSNYAGNTYEYVICGDENGYYNPQENGKISLDGDEEVYYRPAMWLKIN